MPYSNAWSDLNPLGTQNANTIDDELRKLRLDIHERMNNVVVDWTTDPVIPIGGGGGGGNTKAVTYIGTAAPGSRASTYQSILSVLLVKFEGTTAANATIVINLNEINVAAGGGVNWHVDNLYKAGALISPMSFSGKLTAAGITIDVDSMTYNVIDNTIILGFRRDDAGTITNTAINFYATFAFTTVP